MVGSESFRPCVVSAKVVSALGHFGLIWIVISFFFFFFCLFINLFLGQYECVRVVRGGFRQNRVLRDVVGWDRLGRYTQGMVVYLPWVGKRRVKVGRHAG